MEMNDKEIVAAFLASSVNTLEELVAKGESNSLTTEDISGVLGDMFIFARIYLALIHDSLDSLDGEDLASLNKIKAFMFTHNVNNFTS